MKPIVICVLGTCFAASVHPAWFDWGSEIVDAKEALPPATVFDNDPKEMATGQRHTVVRQVVHWKWRYFFKVCTVAAWRGCQPRLVEVNEGQYGRYSIGDEFP